MTLTKPVKIGIIVVLVLIAIVAVYYILKGSSSLTSNEPGIALDGYGNPKSIRFENLV